MEIKDLFITPLFLAIFYLIAYAIRNKASNIYTKKYFIPALTLKFIGALALGIIYQFYYGGGDTFNYFNQAKPIHQALLNSPAIGLKMLAYSGAGLVDSSVIPYSSRIPWFESPEEYFIVRLCAVLGLFCGHTYSTIALMFAFLSFSGMWALYGTFTRLYPSLYQEFAVSVFYIPSVFFWGSGVSKDAICLGALGWLFYAFYNLLVARRTILKAALTMIIAGVIIKSIKIYIIISFIPPVMLWVATQYSAQIKSSLLRILILPLMVVLGVGAGLVLSQSVASGNKNYDFSKIEGRAKVASQYHNSISHSTEDKGRGSGNSGYSMDNFTGPQDIPRLAPKAVVIGLFRPFIWEARNPIMFLSALEIFWITLLTLRIFFRVGFFATIKEISSTPLALFGIIFSLIFAVATALTSGNFGNLVRYRIPMWPFYVTALFLLENTTRSKAKGKRPIKQLKRADAVTTQIAPAYT